MRELVFIPGLAAALLLLGSCGDDFLSVTNPSAQPLEEYYNTDEHLGDALVGCYSVLTWTDVCEGQDSPLMLMSDIMADQMWVGGSDVSDNAFWHLMANYEATPTNCLESLYTDAYFGIRRCNLLLTYIGWAEDLKPERARWYEQQARLLRCYFYSWLWKFWGNIVYYTENLESPYIGIQYTADEVYGYIMEDLDGVLAMDALPMQYTGADLGRVTRAMACMLYAELAMYQNDAARLPTALGYMKEIIDSGLYSLNPDFASIWPYAGEWGCESIFEIDYKGIGQIRNYGFRDAERNAGGSFFSHMISPCDYNADGYDGGFGFGPLRSSTYEMFSPQDSRRDATCMHATADYTRLYQDTGYFLEKYIARGEEHGTTGSSDCGYGRNFRIYRYAETLLNAAELVVAGYGAQSNCTLSDASRWLNEVHHRAGLADELEPTLENIKQERRLEFVGEGKRYWDLVRWGDAETVLVPCTDPLFTTSFSKGRHGSWTPSKKYLPFPQSEIDASQNTMKQNPY